MYFNSKTAEVIFYLVELDGKVRMDKLGVTKAHYSKVVNATKWYNDTMAIINAEEHPMKDKAVLKLSEMYSQMRGF